MIEIITTVLNKSITSTEDEEEEAMRERAKTDQSVRVDHSLL